MSGMTVRLEFPAGLVETAESFVVVYRNQFGVINWAYRDADDLWQFVTTEARQQFEAADGVDGPEGQGAGAFLEDG